MKGDKMEYNPIKKEEVSKMSVMPNLLDYEKTMEDFRWEAISKEFDQFDDGGLNIAYEIIDRHAKTSLKDKVAL
ncbi:MAG TPA: acetate--CoA ligase, partial [Deltaproteobacteria bacterium]|nr:acetate--CoA ligase [Deltaproteobacteria bacterium]